MNVRLGCRVVELKSVNRKRTTCRLALTLVELLVVMAIIGVLIGILIPAVQSVREAARRTVCLNNLKQISMAMLNFENSRRSFPPGFSYPSESFWSAYILPQLDQGAIYHSVELDGPWTTGVPENHDACATYLSVFQCPSSGVVKHVQNAQGIDGRVPCNYIACASGTIDRESGEGPFLGNVDKNISDGVFFENSETRLDEIGDGASNTILVGEAVFAYELEDDDFSGNPQIVDHWYIGSDGLTPYADSSDVSETLGSAACPINSINIEDAPIDSKELCFGSRHGRMAQLGFADGHARVVRDTIDPAVLSALGTRNGGEANAVLD